MAIEIHYLQGAYTGRQIDLPDAARIRFGRHPDNDVCFEPLQDRITSQHHSEMRYEGDGYYYLYDCSSANGTWVGGVAIQRFRLGPETEVQFGQQGPRLLIRLSAVRQDAALPATICAPALPPAVVPPPPANVEPPLPMPPIAAVPPALAATAGKTALLAALLPQVVARSSRRFRWWIAGLALMLVVSVATFLVLFFIERHRSDESQFVLRNQWRREMTTLLTWQQQVAQAEKQRLEDQLTQSQGQLRKELSRLLEQERQASASEKQRLLRQIDELQSKIQATDPEAGQRIVQQHRKALFLLAYDHPSRGPKGFCSAFAVRPRVLATNGHCILALNTIQARGSKPYAVVNRPLLHASRYEILRASPHPAYRFSRSEITQDVGLVWLAVDASATVDLANTTELQSLDAGVPMFTYGFPGRLANATAPEATLVAGVVGRVTNLQGVPSSFGENRLIQHNAFAAEGTSGSPIFNRAGHVVAINAGFYIEPGEMPVLDPASGRATPLLVANRLSGYSFGIRSDTLAELLRLYGQ